MITSNLDQTSNIGITIGKALNAGDIILLSGEMGSGKTTLTKSILSHFGIHPDMVVSPTFSIMNIYQAKQNTQNISTIIHVDTYRIENEEELNGIGLQDYLGAANTLCIIEWPEKAKNILNKYPTTNIQIKLTDNNSREIIFSK